MAAKTASLSVNIIADAAKARAGLKEAETAFGKFRREVGEAQGAMGKFKTIGGSALDSIKQNALGFAAAGGAALMAFAATSVKAASNLAESTNAVRVTFGKAAEGILNFGEKSAEAVGMSSRQFNEFAVQFAGFGEKIVGSGGDIVKVTTDITKRIADFASVMNLDMAEAAQIFQSSLAGETESIRRFGIDMSAAAVEAYALESGLIASKSQLTETIKVQARYGLLMEKTSKFAGDFTNTQDSLANSTKILQAKVEDLQAELGEKLLPVMEEVLQIGIQLVDMFADLGSVPGVSEFFSNLSKFDLNPLQSLAFTTVDLMRNLFGLNKETKNNYEVTSELKGAWIEGYRAMINGRKASDELANSVSVLGAQARNASNLTNGLSDEWKLFLGLLDKRDAFDNAQQAIKEYEETFKKAMKGNKEAMENLDVASRNGARAIAAAMEAADLIPKDQMKNILFLVQTDRLSEALRLLQAVDSWYVTVQQRSMVTPSGMGSGRPPAPIAGPPVASAPRPTLRPAPRPVAPRPAASFGGRTVSTVRLPRMAEGGLTTASGMALVGEEGPELVNLPRGASVIPSIPSRKMMGGGQTIVNIQVQAGLVSSPDQVGAQIIDAIRRAERRSGQVFASV